VRLNNRNINAGEKQLANCRNRYFENEDKRIIKLISVSYRLSFQDHGFPAMIF